MRNILIDLCLRPVYWNDLPEVKVVFNKTELYHGSMSDEKTFSWELPANDNNRLSIFLLNKTDNDTVDNKDKAVIIERIGIEKFYFKSIMLQSLYKPNYSQGYYDYAKKNNIKVDSIIHSNYLGFNGEWYLDITWPTFLWLHEIENLGWIYEKNI